MCPDILFRLLANKEHSVIIKDIVYILLAFCVVSSQQQKKTRRSSNSDSINHNTKINRHEAFNSKIIFSAIYTQTEKNQQKKNKHYRYIDRCRNKLCFDIMHNLMMIFVNYY